MKKKLISGDGFLAMLEDLDKEDHGAMSKEDYDKLKDKWMEIYYKIKHQEKNPLLMSYDDVKGMY